MSVTSPHASPEYVPQSPFVPEPPRKRNRTFIVAAAISAVVLVAFAATLLFAFTSHGKPTASGSTYKPIYGNGGAPIAPTTTGTSSYPNPVADDFKLVPKVTQKQCFGSAGCNVTFTVDLSYVGKGAKPNSTWDITYDAVGTEEALTDTITVHVDGTGMPGTYDSHEELVQTKKTSDAITLRITAIAPGNG